MMVLNEIFSSMVCYNQITFLNIDANNSIKF